MEQKEKIKELELQKEKLLKEISNIDAKINEYKNADIIEVEEKYGIRKNDKNRKCNVYNCNSCIIPCISCYGKICVQCNYGYKNIVDKLKIKYTKDELAELSYKCPYAILASLK